MRHVRDSEFDELLAAPDLRERARALGRRRLVRRNVFAGGGIGIPSLTVSDAQSDYQVLIQTSGPASAKLLTADQLKAIAFDGDVVSALQAARS